jgi:hypothetical protein
MPFRAAAELAASNRSLGTRRMASALSQLNLGIDQRIWVARPESSKGVENSQNHTHRPAGLWVCHPNS